MPWRYPLGREALVAACTGAAVTGVLVRLAPPGGDLAAHEYQRALFLAHGFTLWDNFWYAGRYAFAGYSVLYYPLAAALGIRVLAVLEVAAATAAFAALVGREWGRGARWAARAFALLWAGLPITGEFPFALGVALALAALLALQRGRRWVGSLLTLLTLAASPVAFVLLAVVLAGVAVARRPPRRAYYVPGAALVAGTAIERTLLRLFPPGGALDFPGIEALAAVAFCIGGIALAWGVERAGVLRGVLAAYLVAVVTSYAIPSALGHDVTRLQLLAVPLAVLLLSLRRWRPFPIAVGVVALALAWNVTPLAAGWARADTDASARAAAWRQPIAYLHAHLRPGFRVEAVDTAEHWPAYYLAGAGIPLARGWFRQDDFPLDALLYRRSLTAREYLGWLRRLGVAYVVLTSSPPDYSARREAQLVRGGRVGLRRVFVSEEVSIYAVPRPLPIVRGPGGPSLLALRDSRLVVRVSEAATYRIGVRWSPYWHGSRGCLTRSRDGFLLLRAQGPGTVRIEFDVDPSGLLDAFAGVTPVCRA